MNTFTISLIIATSIMVSIYLFYIFGFKELKSEDGDIETTITKMRISEDMDKIFNNGSHAKLPPIENKGK